MNIDNYLNRIQIYSVEEPDFQFLTKLMNQHLLSIPFENLSVRKGKPIILEESSLFKKIITQKRGGFCYELNGLFMWLLTKLGYRVSLISSEVYNSDDHSFSPEFDHMALLVHLDITYIVDVGFGDAFRIPISLKNGHIEDLSGKYRVSAFESSQNSYIVQKHNAENWQAIYRFTTTPRELIDFNEMCRYNSESPASHFTQKTICTIAHQDGRVTLTDEHLTTTEKGFKNKIEVTSHQSFKKYLIDCFNIDFDNI